MHHHAEHTQPFSTPRQVFDAYDIRFQDEKREHFLIVTLDARHRVMNEHLISIGSLTSSIVRPREVFGSVVREAAGAIVLVHASSRSRPRASSLMS